MHVWQCGVALWCFHDGLCSWTLSFEGLEPLLGSWAGLRSQVLAYFATKSGNAGATILLSVLFFFVGAGLCRTCTWSIYYSMKNQQKWSHSVPVLIIVTILIRARPVPFPKDLPMTSLTSGRQLKCSQFSHRHLYKEGIKKWSYVWQ